MNNIHWISSPFPGFLFVLSVNRTVLVASSNSNSIESLRYGEQRENSVTSYLWIPWMVRTRCERKLPACDHVMRLPKSMLLNHWVNASLSYRLQRIVANALCLCPIACLIDPMRFFVFMQFAKFEVSVAATERWNPSRCFTQPLSLADTLSDSAHSDV